MLAQVFIELELLPGPRVNERRDQLEETPDDERNCKVEIVSVTIQTYN